MDGRYTILFIPLFLYFLYFITSNGIKYNNEDNHYIEIKSIKYKSDCKLFLGMTSCDYNCVLRTDKLRTTAGVLLFIWYCLVFIIFMMFYHHNKLEVFEYIDKKFRL